MVRSDVFECTRWSRWVPELYIYITPHKWPKINGFAWGDIGPLLNKGLHSFIYNWIQGPTLAGWLKQPRRPGGMMMIQNSSCRTSGPFGLWVGSWVVVEFLGKPWFRKAKHTSQLFTDMYFLFVNIFTIYIYIFITIYIFIYIHGLDSLQQLLSNQSW